MQKSIKPSVIKGEIASPVSKSMMQRAVAAALLADGTSILHNPSFCDDALASLDIATKLGAVIENKKTHVLIKGGFKPINDQIHCNESGLSMRMFSPIAAIHSSKINITGHGSLLKRPVNMIEEALKQMDVEIISSNGFLPFSVKGPLKGGNAQIDGSISSQLLTGLLMALPVVETDSVLTVNNLKSKPYIDMTIQLLSDFNINILNKNNNYETFIIQGKQKYKACDYTVEGDWSGASFLLVAAALNGNIKVTSLQKKSFQSDKEIINALEMTGATVIHEKDFTEVHKNQLNAFSFDATECPDLFPPLVALAAHCKGITRIKGAERLKHKESDRATVLKNEFAKLGIEIIINGNEMIIHGGKVHGGNINSHNDHRIAMAGAVAALCAESPVIIDDVECVSKSYPEFFEDLNSVCLTKFQ